MWVDLVSWADWLEPTCVVRMLMTLELFTGNYMYVTFTNDNVLHTKNWS